MFDYLKKYWIEFICTTLVALFSALFGKLKSAHRERKRQRHALCALLRDRIIAIYNRYSDKEYFPIYERENLEHLAREYYALGGNGVVHELCEKLSRLPTKKNDE